ncbi:MAG: hypothetical protein LUO89_11450 [Methanothrix sp.]|nr:hypothetical protein [Methanothrix sp.]
MEIELMINRLTIIPLVLVIIYFAVSPSFGQFLNDSSNETALQAASVVAISNESKQAAVPSLSYIWSITGIESGQVIMVLNQDGGDLYGQAKYEPDSGQAWNAIVIGSVEDGKIYLVLTGFKDKVLFSSRLTGTYDAISGSMKGDLLQVANGSISLRSQFQAMWINPDITSYTAAHVALPIAEASDLSRQTNASAAQAKEESLLSESSQKSRYHDVRQDADRILTGVGDISQIPIGMGGSGLS